MCCFLPAIRSIVEYVDYCGIIFISRDRYYAGGAVSCREILHDGIICPQLPFWGNTPKGPENREFWAYKSHLPANISKTVSRSNIPTRTPLMGASNEDGV